MKTGNRSRITDTSKRADRRNSVATGRVADRQAQSEAEADTRESDLRLVLEASPIALGMVEMSAPNEGRIVLVNRKMTELFGYTLEDTPTIGAWWARVYPDAHYREQVLAAWSDRIARSACDGGEVEPIEVTVMTKDGTYRNVECRMTFAGNRQIVTFVDLTEGRRAAEEMRLQHTALEASTNGVVITNETAHILWVNTAFTKLTGYSREEVIGQSTRILKSGQHGSEFYRELWSTLLSGKSWTGEMTNRRKNGELYHEEMSITPCRNEQGQTTHFVAIKQDVTERKQLEAQYLRAQRMESIGALAGGIAHDLNNVLAPILMSIPLLREHSKGPDSEKVLQILEDSVLHGAELLKQVLTFARGASNQRILLQPAHLVKEFKRMVEHTFPKSVQIELRIEGKPFALMADPTQLNQVLMNLAVNARDAMPEGGRIVIAVANRAVDDHYAAMLPSGQPGRYVVISVSDTGPGMTSTVKERVFEPFFTTKESGKGTGLGLATTKAIVRAHGGFIRLYSELGKGTTFRVYLPAVQTEDDPVASEAEERMPRGNGQLVLVVDDDEGVRAVCGRTLRHFDYRTMLARNGAEAVAMYAQHKDDIAAVVTDWAMPVMDGFATVVALRNINPEVKVICASGLANHEDAKGNCTPEADLFLPKPYTASALLTALNQVLNASQRN